MQGSNEFVFIEAYQTSNHLKPCESKRKTAIKPNKP